MTLLGSLLLALPLGSCNAVGAAPGQSGGVEDVFDRVQSSVVTLRTVQRAVAPAGFGGFVALDGVGSGVLISADGKVLTAAHVVQAVDQVQVEFSDGVPRSAHVVSSSTDADVALVQLDGKVPEWVTPAPLGDSDQVRVGARAFVVGAPLGVTHSLTVGNISARRASPQKLYGLVRVEQFQTDAAINQGNSGGPLFDLSGQVTGIVSYIVTQTGGYQGLGFAVTSNVARKLMLEQPPFWSGIEGVMLDETLAAILNVPGKRRGLLVETVAKGSPAARLGLRGGTVVATLFEEPLVVGGDIVLEVLGVAVDEQKAYDQISARLAALVPGQPLTVRALRAGEVLELSTPMAR